MRLRVAGLQRPAATPGERSRRVAGPAGAIGVRPACCALRRMYGRKPAFDNARRVAPYCAAGFGEECKWTTDLAAWGRAPARFGLEKGS